MCPESAEFDVGLRHVQVGQEEPEAKDRLGEDVENSVCNDLAVDVDIARAIRDAPNAG